MNKIEVINYDEGQVLEPLIERDDAANKVQLHPDPNDPHGAIVTVEPKDHDGLPFGIRVDGARARDAYDHPYPYAFTPGIESPLTDERANPWDPALDAYNELPKAARRKAMESFDRIRQGEIGAPTVLLDAVRRQRQQREIDRAA